jgi:hypothetical protein
MHGASSSLAWNADNWLGFVGDWGVYHGSPGVSLTTNTFAKPLLGHRDRFWHLDGKTRYSVK